ncbi:MAG: permease-like cell division protein FtsX [Nocardioidaceae bacterium]
MQLRYVASELGTGLKRNVSMTVAVIVTIWLSLALVGLGLLMRDQVKKIEDYLGGQLEVPITFCTQTSNTPACVGGVATKQQEQAVENVIKGSDYVASYRYRTREQFYQGFRASHTDKNGNLDSLAKQLKISDMPTTYFVKLKSADDMQAFTTQVDHLPGVMQVVNLRSLLNPVYSTLNVVKWLALGGAGLLVLAAVLQISNTIRLAAMARRREIGIMRLVGASSLYIQLPFVLEVVVSALVGAALACGTLAAALKFIVPWLRGHLQLWPWIDWANAAQAMVVVVVIAVILAIIPTLLTTRKYLKV